MTAFRYLLPLLMFSWVVYAQEPLNLPPPGSGSAERVKIPIKAAEEAIEKGETGDATNEEAVAFSIAAQAKGWIPEGSAGILRPGVRVKVSVMIQGQSEFRIESQRINQSGVIGLPLLMNVHIGGMDMEEAENMITERYKEFYREPLVNVEFDDDTGNPSLSPWGYVTMLGNINAQGPIAIPPSQVLTISGALKLAGGTAASAKKTSIRIFRPLPEEGSVERIIVDLNILGKKGNQAEDITLRAGDVVFIPERIF